MTEWWEALSSLGRVFACIAIPATLVLLIQTILSIIGLSGSDGDADVPDGGIDIDGDGIPDVFPDATPDGVFGSDVAVAPYDNRIPHNIRLGRSHNTEAGASDGMVTHHIVCRRLCRNASRGARRFVDDALSD